MVISGDYIATVYVLLQQILIVGVICASTTRNESAILLLSKHQNHIEFHLNFIMFFCFRWRL